jgi:hypothetical protein
MTKRKPYITVPVVHDMARLERIAAAIRARPRDYAANNALTAALSREEQYEVGRLIDAQATAVQDAEAAQEAMERRASYRRRPSRQRQQRQHATWPYWLWLLLTAVALYYAKGPLLVLAAVVGVLILWVRFALRFPLTAIAVAGFLRGLLGGRR